MNRYTPYILGPELIWALLYVFTLWLAARNQPPTVAGSQKLELIGWFLPVVGVVLSFLPLAFEPGRAWWWLLRIVLVGAVGVFVVTGRLCGAIDYSDSRNSGVGTAYVLFVGLGLMALLLGAVITTIVFLLRR